MRVLVVFHGWLPRDDRPASGGATRAWHHGEALRAAGHEVLYVTRDQDAIDGGPPVFANASQLRQYAKSVRPDRILCVQPEEAPALTGLGAPVCVDLYAPRLLEAAWQSRTDDEAVATLRALAAADEFLFSNPRQRWFYLGLLALAGVDLRRNSGRVVPLVAPEGPARKVPRNPVLVMGGVAWPWQDPTEALRATVAHLEKRRKGKLVVYGGRPAIGDAEVVDLPAAVPAGPRLEYAGSVPWPELLQAYSQATAALDIMEPNAEREVALAFRHVDYLGCGLPIITGGYHALELGDAGWITDVEGLEDVLDLVLDNRDEVLLRSGAASTLARTKYSRSAAERPLLDWVEHAEARDRMDTPLLDAANLKAELGRVEGEWKASANLLARSMEEVEEKRADVTALNAQVQSLTGTVERLTRTLDEVAGFKREAVRVLGSERDAAGQEVKELARELSDLRADLAKKDVELRSAQREQDRLNDALAALKDETAYAGERLLEAGRREDRLRQERDAAREPRGLLSRVLGRK